MTVICPTPPGTGVMYDAFSFTPSKSTSPTMRPSGKRLKPTSITTAPVFTICGTIRFGTPAATTRMSREQREIPEVARLLVTDDDRRVLLHQHQRGRLADDVARADHTTTFWPSTQNVLVLEDLLHTIRRARREHRVAGDQAAHVVQMETIDILLDGNLLQHARHPDVRRQRQLHQDTVHGDDRC